MTKDAEAIIPGPAPDSPKRKPTMLATDLSLRFDPAYEKISCRFLNNPQAFTEAFARTWFKLMHRDLKPKSHYLGPGVPREDLIWQGPLPAVTHKPTGADIADLKARIAASSLSTSELVVMAQASTLTFCGSDEHGDADGARIHLAPQDDQAVNRPMAGTLAKLEEIQHASDKASLADVIVLVDSVGIELAARAAGTTITVPFTPGCVNVTAEQADAASFSVLELAADSFHSYQKSQFAVPTEVLLLDRAQLLTLTTSELTVLIGGLRVINVNADGSQHGVLTHTPGTLMNDFFVSLFDMSTERKPTDDIYEDYDRKTGEREWTGTRINLTFGSNSILRALTRVFGSANGKERFISEFVAAWVKMMNLDRFDLAVT